MPRVVQDMRRAGMPDVQREQRVRRREQGLLVSCGVSELPEHCVLLELPVPGAAGGVERGPEGGEVPIPEGGAVLREGNPNEE